MEVCNKCYAIKNISSFTATIPVGQGEDAVEGPALLCPKHFSDLGDEDATNQKKRRLMNQLRT